MANQIHLKRWAAADRNPNGVLLTWLDLQAYLLERLDGRSDAQANANRQTILDLDAALQSTQRKLEDAERVIAELRHAAPVKRASTSTARKLPCPTGCGGTVDRKSRYRPGAVCRQCFWAAVRNGTSTSYRKKG